MIHHTLRPRNQNLSRNAYVFTNEMIENDLEKVS
jgi:hypothetical protein